MLLGGLQKLTLLDFPGRVACTVFTLGCNFRCPFCHNAPLVSRPEVGLSKEEFLSFLEKRRGLLDGVCVTGGEPFAQKDILSFFEEIREQGYAVKVDTNGSYPDRLSEAVDRGLVDYVAMDVKNSKRRYAETVGLKSTPSGVYRSIELLLEGRVPYEFRTTVVEELHRPEDFLEIGELIRGAERYFLQTFEDSGDLIGEGMTAPSALKMRACLEAVRPYVPSAALRGKN